MQYNQLSNAVLEDVMHNVSLQDPCPLCIEAKEALEPFRHRVRQHICLPVTLIFSICPTDRLFILTLQFVLQQVDISLPENRVWFDRYKWDIPVFHLNGQFVMKHRVDVMLLLKLLQEAETLKTDH